MPNDVGGNDDQLDKLVSLVMRRESSGRLYPPDSETGAIGPMQIEPSTGKMYGVEPALLRIPSVNIGVGRRYLKDLLKQYNGDVYRTLAAYNAGPGRVATADIPSSTKRYVRDIMGKLGTGVTGALGEGTAAAQESPGRKFTYTTSDGRTYWSDGAKWYDQAGKAMPSAAAGVSMAPSSVKIKGLTFTNPNAPTTATITREQRLSQQGGQVLQMADDLKKLYDLRIAPKLKAGKIGSFGQGVAYYSPRYSPTEADPDVQEFITKTGAFAQLVNAYYSGQGGAGGRAGVGSYQVITTPHIPHPPGFEELLSGTWDLGKQGEQLNTIIKTVKLMEKQGTPENYGKPIDKTTAPDGTIGVRGGRQIVAHGGVAYDVGPAQ